jgi:hypothetical protein
MAAASNFPLGLAPLLSLSLWLPCLLLRHLSVILSPEMAHDVEEELGLSFSSPT